MRSTFHGFTTALSGMNISQKALDVTGQNIANMGKSGFTRQRLDLYSVGASRVNDLYASRSDKMVGQGVGVTNVSNIRDPFLDVRFRREAAKTGEIDANLSMLEDLESLFDETQNAALGAQLKDLKTQLNKLVPQTGSTEFDSIVRSSAQSLTNLMNQYATQIANFRSTEDYNFQHVSVPNVNDILKNISKLNESIKKSEIAGSPSLELMDDRNLLLDELSTYMDINVTYTPTQIAPGVSVNILSVSMAGKNGTTQLLHDDRCSQFSSSKDPVTGEMQLSVSNDFGKKIQQQAMDAAPPAGTGLPLWNPDGTPQMDPTPVTPPSLNLTNELNTGIFKGSLDALNKSGEFDNPATDSKGLGYYEKRLDLMAANFAQMFNEANSIANPVHDPNSAVGDAIRNPAYPDDDPINEFIPNPPKYAPGDWRPLFGTNDGSNVVTSKNICIADGWKNNKYTITTSKGTPPTSGDASGKNENVLEMLTLLEKPSSYTITKQVQKVDANGDPVFEMKADGSGPDYSKPVYDSASQSVFKGTLQEYFGDCGNVLALDVKSQTNALNNRQSLLQGIADLQDSVSAVSLDEEGVNLLQFQKSYSAAARFMTALDQALDTLINRTGTVGL